ncbi:MAG: glycosyltransferase [Gemmataceae bacterium]|nr:glycosyltransferase [Gemmataceae bacterium]MCI0739335.1 glycosyltransferase [Gemmataceae bacterium]
MTVVHLVASPFFGGPERQMLGLALALPAAFESRFLSFFERGLCLPFLHQLRSHGFMAKALEHNAPRINACVGEVAAKLRQWKADLLLCHGYKPDLVGWLAARRAGVPVVSVSRGWTGANWKVRLYDWMDRTVLFAMDRVICVSEGQAAKVRKLGVPAEKVRVIRNAIAAARFEHRDQTKRADLEALFKLPSVVGTLRVPLSADGTRSVPATLSPSGSGEGTPRVLVGAAGRLSPEKGFADLIDAAAMVLADHPEAGFVLFGDGPLRDDLQMRIENRGLTGRFVLAGFRDDLDALLPNLDVFVQSSYTEGLPNVVLEALAARVPVVATAVGGTPEILHDGETGFLVEPRDSTTLARRIGDFLADEELRKRMDQAGCQFVRAQCTFAAQARQYEALFAELGASKRGRRRMAA